MRFSRGKARQRPERRGWGAGLGEGWGGGDLEAEEDAGAAVPVAGPHCVEPPPPHQATGSYTSTLARNAGNIFSLMTLLAKYKSSSFFPCKKHVHQNRPCSACWRGRPLDLVRGLRKGLRGEGYVTALCLSAVGGRHKNSKNSNKIAPRLLSAWSGLEAPLSILALCNSTIIISIFQMRKLSPERGIHLPKVTQQSQALNPQATQFPRDA